MNLKEAREILLNDVYPLNTFNNDERKQLGMKEKPTDLFRGMAKGFLEGYEAGVREAAETQMRGCRREEFVPVGSSLACEHMDRRDKILKLLDEWKK